MPTFQPPTDDFVNLANIDVDERQTEDGRRAINLFRHFDNLPRGRNVYKLNSGVYVENEPVEWSSIVKIYYGGHIYDVTSDEAADLTAAGYGTYIS